MIIGIDIRTLMDKQYSGVSEYTLNLVNALLEVDQINEYRLFYNSFSDISENIPRFGASNVKIIKKQYPNKLLNYLFFTVLDYPKVDDILGCDVFLMPHINFVSLTKNAKSILIVHDLSFLRYPEFFSGRKNLWHSFIDIKDLVNRFDTVVAISENTKQDIVDLLKVNEGKIEVIHSGLCVIDKVVDDKLDLPDRYFLYLGTVEPRKNIESIIKAYIKLREKSVDYARHKLVIAGGKGWRCNQVYEMAGGSIFYKDIVFAGYIKKEHKYLYYKNASIFIFPSIYEGFGFPPLEAMHLGIPVIASNTSCLPEVLQDAALLIDPLCVNEIILAIEALMESSELRDKFVKKGFEVIKKYSWPKVAQLYLDVLMKDKI
ncbi:glycosyltransferase family 4 protein [Patescibacteria group bacterium]|nr:glycosyltransferase family 4 protein [Patescibacteria group bacterium]